MVGFVRHPLAAPHAGDAGVVLLPVALVHHLLFVFFIGTVEFLFFVVVVVFIVFQFIFRVSVLFLIVLLFRSLRLLLHLGDVGEFVTLPVVSQTPHDKIDKAVVMPIDSERVHNQIFDFRVVANHSQIVNHTLV